MKNTIRDNVENILKTDPQARNSDKLLMCDYWYRYCGLSKEKAMKLYDFLASEEVPSLESIRRARQLVQAEGLYQANDVVTAARRTNERKMRKALRTREVI